MKAQALFVAIVALSVLGSPRRSLGQPPARDPASPRDRAGAEESAGDEAVTDDEVTDEADAAERADDAPPIGDVVRAALRWSRADPERSRRALRRARRAAWLPELRLRARRGRERDQAQSSTGTNLSTDDDTVLEATLVFDLPRAVYGPDEVAWSREERALQNARLRLVRLVIRLYFERRRLLIEERLGADDFEIALRIAEIEALLDHLTGGMWSRGRE